MLRDGARLRTRLVLAVPLGARGELAPEGRLALAAAVIGILFGTAFVASQPIWAGQPSGPPGPGGTGLPGVGWPGAAIAVAFALALLVPYRAYAHAREAATCSVNLKLVGGLTVLLAATTWLMYPRFGSDVFDYLGFERMWVIYGDNPLFAVPAAHPQDWSTPLVWFPAQPLAYGPLWAALTWPVARLAGDSASLAVLGYKLLALGGYGVCCALICWSVEPRRRAAAVVQFAWSPLVLFEVVGKAHNDVLVAIAAVAAASLLHRRRPFASTAACVVGALVKATSLALLPVLLLGMRRPTAGRALAGGLILMALAYAPFWAGPRTLEPLLIQTGRNVWSPATLLVLALGHDAMLPVRLGLGGLWLLILAWLVRARGGEVVHGQVASTAAWLMLASLLLLSTAVYAHYLVPVVALAAVSGEARLQRASLWLSMGALAAYSVEVFGIAVGSDWLGSPGYQLAGSLLITAPAALVLIRVWRDRVRSPTAG